jgi:hypothetical protein
LAITGIEPREQERRAIEKRASEINADAGLFKVIPSRANKGPLPVPCSVFLPSVEATAPS